MAFPESPMDPDDVAYPCKGCGQVSCPVSILWRTVTFADHFTSKILEEGKAFELGMSLVSSEPEPFTNSR